jgi:hypothetical protein
MEGKDPWMPGIPNVWDVAPVRTDLRMISAPCAQVMKGRVSRGGAEERGDQTRRPEDRIRRVEGFLRVLRVSA